MSETVLCCPLPNLPVILSQKGQNGIICFWFFTHWHIHAYQSNFCFIHTDTLSHSLTHTLSHSLHASPKFQWVSFVFQILRHLCWVPVLSGCSIWSDNCLRDMWYLVELGISLLRHFCSAFLSLCQCVSLFWQRLFFFLSIHLHIFSYSLSQCLRSLIWYTKI